MISANEPEECTCKSGFTLANNLAFYLLVVSSWILGFGEGSTVKNVGVAWVQTEKSPQTLFRKETFFHVTGTSLGIVFHVAYHLGKKTHLGQVPYVCLEVGVVLRVACGAMAKGSPAVS